MRWWLLLVMLVGVSARAEDADLAARVDALARLPALDESVRRPLELAQAALARSKAAPDEATKQRTEGLARAALELAEARVRLLRERLLLRAARTRRASSSEERETAQRAIERERARLNELERSAP